MTPEDNKRREAPGGLLGAWFNVIVCTGIVIGAAIYTITQGLTGPDTLIGAGVVVVGVVLDISFVRTLRRHSARTKS